jgi:hypothetical protein
LLANLITTKDDGYYKEKVGVVSAWNFNESNDSLRTLLQQARNTEKNIKTHVGNLDQLEHITHPAYCTLGVKRSCLQDEHSLNFELSLIMHGVYRSFLLQFIEWGAAGKL